MDGGSSRQVKNDDILVEGRITATVGIHKGPERSAESGCRAFSYLEWLENERLRSDEDERFQVTYETRGYSQGSACVRFQGTRLRIPTYSVSA